MCRDILNTCVRNTEEAERAAHPTQAEVPSGRGQGKGVWMMIEESELAKTFRQDEQKKVDAPGSDAHLSPTALETDGADEVLSSPKQKDSDVMLLARSCKTELDDYLARTPSSSTSPVSPSAELNPELEKRARTTLKALGQMIEASEDPGRLEELLSLNDDLTASLSRFSISTGGWKRTGLGIHVQVGNERLSVVPNGHAVAGGEEEPSTPRIDKGKGRAEPEPEKPELVLSPTLGGTESDEDEPEQEGLAEHVSPTDR